MSLQEQVAEATADLDFANKQYQIKLETNHGEILLDLLPDVAPGHCRNIIGLTRTGYYDGLIFHRVIDGFMIQGGCPQGTGTGNPGYQIDAEFNSTHHAPGVLSMARSNDPNSAGSQFFVCVADAGFLDNQYTAFGQTANDESLAVAQAIGKTPTDSGDRPLDEVKIEKASVIEL